MTQLVYLVGAPGVGKSTAVAGVLDQMELYRGEPELIGEKLFWGEPLFSQRWRVGVMLGKTEGTYSGTDRLGMQVSPEAVRWVTEGCLPPFILGEGARLAHPKFLTAAARSCMLLVVHLVANQDQLDARCTERGSNQRASWRKTVATTARNTTTAARLAGAQTVQIDTTELSPAEVADTVCCLL